MRHVAGRPDADVSRVTDVSNINNMRDVTGERMSRSFCEGHLRPSAVKRRRDV